MGCAGAVTVDAPAPNGSSLLGVLISVLPKYSGISQPGSLCGKSLVTRLLRNIFARLSSALSACDIWTPVS